MAQVINTSSLSLLIQNNLNKSQSSLDSAIEHLFFGLRINSAKDGAADRVTANRFAASAKGLTQASRNANGGISAVRTAEGALNEINNSLQRVRELTVQATSGTNSDSNLSSIRAEITQRLEEIDRVSEQTQFNDVKVPAESNEIKVRVGANDGETITTNLAKIDAKALGLDSFNIGGAQKATGGDLVSRFRATGTDSYQISGTGSYTVSVDSGAVRGEDGDAVLVSTTDGSLTTKSDTEVGGTGIDMTGFVKATVSLAKDASIKYQGITFANRGTGAFDGSDNGTLTVNIDGKDVTFTVASSTGATGKDVTLTTSDPVYKNSAGQLTTTKVENKTATVPDLDLNNVKKAGNSLIVNGADYEISADGKVVAGLGKTTYLNKSEGGGPILVSEDATRSLRSATNPLETIDKVLVKVDNLRSDLGTVQNRFDSAITNLGNTVNNLSSTRSRIEDVNYATEVSNMSRTQILQQVGTSILAQASQITQNIPSLLH